MVDEPIEARVGQDSGAERPSHGLAADLLNRKVKECVICVVVVDTFTGLEDRSPDEGEELLRGPAALMIGEDLLQATPIRSTHVRTSSGPLDTSKLAKHEHNLKPTGWQQGLGLASLDGL